MATPAPHPTEQLLIIGASHRTATTGLRDRLMSEPIDHAPYLADLRGAGLGESVLLATCDRFEIVTVAEDFEVAGATLRRLFAQWVEAEPELLDDLLVEHQGAAALRHLFAVAASLDSQVVGEPQVLGQVKESHRQAQAASTIVENVGFCV